MREARIELPLTNLRLGETNFAHFDYGNAFDIDCTDRNLSKSGMSRFEMRAATAFAVGCWGNFFFLKRTRNSITVICRLLSREEYVHFSALYGPERPCFEAPQASFHLNR